VFVTREEMLQSGQPISVFLHAIHAQVCPACRAVVLGEKGGDDEDMNAHMRWHNAQSPQILS